MKKIITKIALVLLFLMSAVSCKKEKVAPQNIVSISAASDHTLLLFENGDVYCTGYSGGNPSNDVTKFKYLRGNIKKIKANWDMSLILTDDNQLITCGRSDNYSLAGDRNTIGTGAVRAWQYLTTCDDFDANLYYLFTSSRSPSDGKLYFSVAGNNRSNAIQRSSAVTIPMLSAPNDTIRKVFLGSLCLFMNHNYNNTNNLYYAIGGGGSDGEKLGVGVLYYQSKHLDDFAALLDGNTPLDVKKISCSEFSGHTLLLTNDGRLFVAGNNTKGQLGTGNNTNYNLFTYVTDNVKDIATGDAHSMILKNDNSVWVCGDNRTGSLGNGTYDDLNTFTKVFENARLIEAGGRSSFIVTNENRLYAAGHNDVHQLGIKGTALDSNIGLFREIPIDVLL